MNKLVGYTAVAVVTALGIATVSFAVGDNDAVAELAATKVSLLEAVAAAQTQSGGRATQAELETEDGVALYEIELVVGNKVKQLKVNAVTGAVVASEADDPL